MKKKLLLTSAFTLISSLAMQAQTIVSTTSENKNVVLEEFTGINCVYCPQGHAIAESIKSANPNDVFLINIHTGGFATPSSGQPDFTTSFGAALATQSGLTGYPSGTVNRKIFSGTSTALSRGDWTNAANQVLTESAYVNVATQASVDINTREVTVLVEAYYTGTGNVNNKLNLALLQNNTEGPQTGGNMGNSYMHQHRLVHLITGQWGEDITTTSQGSFISKTYTYTIPYVYNSIPVELSELEVVAYVTEDTQEIINGHGTDVTYSSNLSNDASLGYISEFTASCEDNNIAPEIVITNNGNNSITSLNIDYSINNGTLFTYNWSGNLGLAEAEKITLPQQTYTLQSNNTVNVSLNINDDDLTNNDISNIFVKPEGTRNITVDIRTDYYPGEITWEIYDSANALVASGGPYVGNADGSGGGQDALKTKSHSVTLPQADCYTVKLLDSYGDGWGVFNSTLTPGVDIYSQGNLIYTADVGNFGSKYEVNGAFSANSTLSVNDNILDSITLYPNPSANQIFITELDNFDISIVDVRGVSVLTAKNLKNNTPINIENLETGVYFVNLKSENTQKTLKLIKE